MEAAIGDVLDKLERDVTKGSSSRMSSSRALLSKMGLPSMSPPTELELTSRRRPVLDVGPAPPRQSPVLGIIRPLPPPTHTLAKQSVLRERIVEVKRKGFE